MRQANASRSSFRMVALVTSVVAAILFMFCAVAVFRYGGSSREFGWIPTRAGGVVVVGQVNPRGPADGLLQPGDVLVAWDGDRRATRVPNAYFRRNLPPRPDAEYTLTIQRAGVEKAVTLTAPPRTNRRYASVVDFAGDLIPALRALPTAVDDPDAETGVAGSLRRLGQVAFLSNAMVA